MTKKHVLLVALVLAANTSQSIAAITPEASNAPLQISPAQQQELERAAQEKIQHFSAALKGVLMGAVKQGGFTAAVEVCHEQAPDIATAFATDGWELRRTSLKARNSQNQPDDWERATLATFAQQLQDGISFAELQNSQITPERYRYMQAIPTGQLCLACHGSNIEPQLASHIKKLYPDDQATGFAVGDIRGAFTLSKTLSTKEN